MKVKEKLLAWWNSENCFLKNRWFQFFSPLIVVIVAVATFFTGGLFLLASLAVIPLLAYLAEKGELNSEKQSQRAKKWFGTKNVTTETHEYQSVATDVNIIPQTLSDESSQKPKYPVKEVYIQSLDDLPETSTTTTRTVIKKNSDPVHAYKKAVLLFAWFYPNAKKPPYLEEFINEAVASKKQAFPELEEMGIFDYTVQDWLTNARNNQKFLLKKELAIYHEDKRAFLPDNIVFNGVSIVKNDLIQFYTKIQIFIYKLCVEKSCPINEEIDPEDYDRRLEQVARAAEELLIEVTKMYEKAREETQKAREETQKARESRKAQEEKTQQIYEQQYLPKLKNRIITKDISNLRFMNQHNKAIFMEAINDLYKTAQITRADINWLVDNKIVLNEDLPKEMQKKTMSFYIKNFLWSNNNIKNYNATPSPNQPAVGIFRVSSSS